MDDALELDELDKKRINSNINLLKEKNIPYLEYMVKIPINSLTTIKSKEEIINKMLVDYLIAGSASYMISDSVFLVGDLLDNINKKYSTDALLTIEDKSLIINMINKLYTPSELEEFCIKLESVNICLWALGLIDKIDSFNKCNVNLINKILFKYKSYEELVKNSKLRSKEEILSASDLVTRYYWAIRDIKDDSKELNELSEKILNIQNETFEFITSYSYDSLSNKNIKIEYNKDDLKFEFEIPSYLNFERVSETSKELMALKSDDASTRIVMQDLGRIEKEEFDTRVNKYIRLFKKSGFTLQGDYSLYSTFLREKLIRIVVRKGSTSLNSYFMFVSNHLIRMDSLIESYIDSKNYNEIMNSENTNIDLDIIFSIREITID